MVKDFGRGRRGAVHPWACSCLGKLYTQFVLTRRQFVFLGCCNPVLLQTAAHPQLLGVLAGVQVSALVHKHVQGVGLV